MTLERQEDPSAVISGGISTRSLRKSISSYMRTTFISMSRELKAVDEGELSDENSLISISDHKHLPADKEGAVH
ncbi:MAG: hypothetical protein MZV63_51745 [Marinilabiliales bacterium]|nr:hypothetical protein [Marinilabiliales bacterium]